MIRYLADENFHGDAVKAMRERGMDVAWVCEDQASADDTSVLARSHKEQRVLLTLDKDFGELVYRKGAACSSGVILFRLGAPSPQWVTAQITAAVLAREDWLGMFTVVEPGRVRMTPLPGQRV